MSRSGDDFSLDTSRVKLPFFDSSKVVSSVDGRGLGAAEISDLKKLYMQGTVLEQLPVSTLGRRQLLEDFERSYSEFAKQHPTVSIKPDAFPVMRKELTMNAQQMFAWKKGAPAS